ncbi:uncharacterized protein Dvir_GJ26870 [Drosophila virilis]|uniref:Uncharacterized protein n=1 Tax=Drosophila virilis TaxID=7244 RepID=A0A0Q9W7D0_DROVI|nr:uncharacterized protein Dvir_GJ26870 [Drosophila virilis]
MRSARNTLPSAINKSRQENVCVCLSLLDKSATNSPGIAITKTTSRWQLLKEQPTAKSKPESVSERERERARTRAIASVSQLMDEGTLESS